MSTLLEDWRTTEADRRHELQELGAFWYHDGNERRPYVRLRSGLISNGYFNGAVLCERPLYLSEFVKDLVVVYTKLDSHWLSGSIQRVVGPAMGAITLAHEVARCLEDVYRRGGYDDSVHMSFAEKEGDGFVFKRSKPVANERILLVEDTITTGGSVLKVCNAISETAPNAVRVPVLLALCNRSGSETLDGMQIASLVSGDFRTWKEGENPFTPDGKEHVPVVENVKDNWNLLTRDY